jgi:hypothetical protein
MDQWERTQFRGKSKKELDTLLKRLGDEGWEVIDIQGTGGLLELPRFLGFLEGLGTRYKVSLRRRKP